MRKVIAGGILTALATLILCVCLTACSTNIVGTYKFYSMKGNIMGVEVELKVGEEFMGVGKLTEDYMVLTINEDNTLELTTMGTTMKGSWREDGGKYYLTIAGEEQEVSVSGSKLTMKEDGNTLVLKK